MNNPTILFRMDLENEAEFEIAKSSFNTVQYRSEIPKDSIIIPRYSALPFFKELEHDIINLGSSLINSKEQFDWIANFEYYELIKDLTFKTYFDAQSLPDKKFVVKGKTNSRKHQWNKMFFADSRRKAIEIACDLKQDALIGEQDIIFREFEELLTFETLLNGLPVTNEFRFFFYKDIELCHGYYWSCAENPEKGKLDDNALKLVKTVSNKVKNFNNFYTVDIAQKKNLDWIVVELNSGEMSGLSLCDPKILYNNLRKNLTYALNDV